VLFPRSHACCPRCLNHALLSQPSAVTTHILFLHFRCTILVVTLDSTSARAQSIVLGPWLGRNRQQLAGRQYGWTIIYIYTVSVALQGSPAPICIVDRTIIWGACVGIPLPTHDCSHDDARTQLLCLCLATNVGEQPALPRYRTAAAPRPDKGT
jgi:hypothetical protein